MQTITISDARANIKTLVDQVTERFDKVYITVNGTIKAALVNAEELESLEETAHILTLQNAKQSIEKGVAQAKKRKGIPLTQLID